MSDAQGQRARHVDAGQRPPCPRATCFWSRLADIPAGRLTKFGVLVVWLAISALQGNRAAVRYGCGSQHR